MPVRTYCDKFYIAFQVHEEWEGDFAGAYPLTTLLRPHKVFQDNTMKLRELIGSQLSDRIAADHRTNQPQNVCLSQWGGFLRIEASKDFSIKRDDFVGQVDIF